MSEKTFLRFTSLTTFIIGSGFLLAPLFVTNIFLRVPMEQGSIFARFLGSALMGYSYLNWATARYNRSDSREATLIGNLATLSIALVLSILAMVNSTFNSKGILIVLLHLIFAGGFAYYLNKKLTSVKPRSRE